MKKSIAIASILAAASTAVAEPKTSAEAIAQYTGPNQPQNSEICLKASPYFISSFGPEGVVSQFYSFVIDGSGAMAANEKGACEEVDWQTKQCPVGFVKVTSTTPLACNVPIGL